MGFLILRACTIAWESGLAETLEHVNQMLLNIFNLAQFSPEVDLGRARYVLMVQHF